MTAGDDVLGSSWHFTDFPPGAGERAGAHRPETATSDWSPIDVPGDVHTALVRTGRLPDPFYALNEASARWVEGREWWYRTVVTIHDAPVVDPLARRCLVFAGLDTFCTVYLNGEVLGTTSNMFREHTFDVGSLLRSGSNTVCLRFDPPSAHVRDRADGHWAANDVERVAMRKAQFGFGWDWGPRLPTVGVWRACELRIDRVARLRPVGFRTVELSRDHSRALVAVRIQVDRVTVHSGLVAVVRLRSPDGAELFERQLTMRPGEDDVEGFLEVEQPQLWWTHDLGLPALYTLEVVLRDNTEGDPAAPADQAAVLDRSVTSVGIRTVRLDQSPDVGEPGARFFRFLLNGYPLFARGANWIPCDSFLGSIPPGRYEALLAAARDGNANMLRVWGGGIYEHDAFYDTCDALGILIWQDFMFACGSYPEDDEFAAEVDREARYQVRRLRAHPCLALWCGNNENQWLHDVRHWNEPGAYLPGSLLWDRVLPAAVDAEDGQTAYWLGSPFGGNDHNSMLEGDRHNWDVWHGNRPFDRHFGEAPSQDATPDGVDVRHYERDLTRFSSEFGLHAAPELVTLRAVVPDQELYLHSPAMDQHNNDTPKNKSDNLMANITGLPVDVEQYVAFSQTAQAEGLKVAVEHYRRRKPHCSGALVWQLNDCWPAESWAYIDYHGVPKAAYYTLRRAFAPVLASFRDTTGGGVELWICNDSRDVVQATLTVRHESFSGDVLFENVVEAEVAAGIAGAVWQQPAHQLRRDAKHLVTVRCPDLDIANRHFFVPARDLPLTARPTLSVTPTGPSRAEVDVSADGYVMGLSLAPATLHTRVSDGHLDLRAGETVRLFVEDTEGALDPMMIKARWFEPRRTSA